MTAPAHETLLNVTALKKHFPIGNSIFGGAGSIKAVDGVDLAVERGRTLGLVGESGCGKSTVGRLLVRLIEATAGSIRFEGDEIRSLTPTAMRRRRRDMQMIFQDPFSSLNPRMTAGEIVMEPLQIHRVNRGSEETQTARLFELVGLSRTVMDRYPHEFSGGQRQRIGIARAVALRPKFIVCDEAVSALDVSIQSQVLNLLRDIQVEMGVSYLFISHNLSVVDHVSDHVAVMYLGKIVETADKKALFTNPRHPYTQALLSAVPEPSRARRRERIILQGDVPSPISPPSGCAFRTRCPHAMDVCAKVTPPLETVAPGHLSACHLNRLPTQPLLN